MTIRDPEVLEALRDQPELLAIADAVEETQRPLRRTHRRVFTRAAVVVAVGAAALVAVLLWPSDGNRSPILERALAAIGDGPVLHVVTQVPSGQELVDLQTGRSTMPTFEIESCDVEATTGAVTKCRDGRPIRSSRYMKTLYGVKCAVEVKCGVDGCEAQASFECEQDEQASAFEELS